jgi:hypothetical protein
MKIMICLMLSTTLTLTLWAQTVSYYSNTMKGQVSLDASQMQSSNSRVYAMMLDEGEQVVSHQIEGLGKKTDSLKDEAQKLQQKSVTPDPTALAQVQSGIRTEEQKKKELEAELAIIEQGKTKAMKLMDDERKRYVNVTQMAKAQAAASRAAQFQPTTHHDFYSPAYEQLKHINATGNW